MGRNNVSTLGDNENDGDRIRASPLICEDRVLQRSGYDMI